MLAGGVGDYSVSDDAGLRAVLDVWMLASCDDLVIPQSYMALLAFPQE